MYLFFGFILGLLNFVDFGIFGLGELILLFYLFINTFKRNHSFKISYPYGFLMLALCSLIFIFTSNNLIFTIKGLLKWLIIFFEVNLISKMLFKDKKKTLKILIPFLTISKLIESIGEIGIFSRYLHYSIFIFTFILIYYYDENKKNEYLVYLSCLFFFFFGFSRIAILILCVFLLYRILIYILNNKKTSNLKKIINIVLVLFIATSIVFGLNIFLSNISVSTDSNTERMFLINLSIKEFLDNPIIGVGPGNYYTYALQNYGIKLRLTDLSAHNLFLEILAEFGIIGFIMLLIALIPCFKVLFDNNSSTSLKYLSLYLFVFYFFSPMSGVSRLVFTIFYSIIINDLKKGRE